MNGKKLGTTVPVEMADAIRLAGERRRPRLGVSGMVRVLLRESLTARGLWPPRGDDADQP